MSIVRMIRDLLVDDPAVPDPARLTDGEVTRRIREAREASERRHRARQQRAMREPPTYRGLNRAAFGREPWPREEGGEDARR